MPPCCLPGSGFCGVGVGVIASQILTLIISSVESGDGAETAGLNGTFEQLGNALGVALVGTMMLVALNANLERGLAAGATIPPLSLIHISEPTRPY